MNDGHDNSDGSDGSLLNEFESMWDDADTIWTENHDGPGFHGYVSADYMAVFEELARMRGRASTFLEWGSGLGVVAIMASKMGFEAYGIESEPELVDHALDLAEAYESDARFAQGSFIPDNFIWNPADGEEVVRTVIDAPAAYDELEMELRDFDLIYAYPWPDERILFQNIVRQFGCQNAQLLLFDVREGLELIRFFRD